MADNHTERIGLYIMVFIILMNTCSIEVDTQNIKRNVEKIMELVRPTE